MQALLIQQIIFYIYSLLLIASAIMVIVAKNPVRAALFLVLVFFCSAVLWMLLQAEFLSLVLIFVYVGAVMTLFLFVVMMINLDLVAMREGFVRYLPYGILVSILLGGTMWLVLTTHYQTFSLATKILQPSNYDNTKSLGELLYTDYIYAFELAGFILLVAIVAAISLAFHGRQHNTKAQKITKQLSAKKKDRLRILTIKAEKR